MPTHQASSAPALSLPEESIWKRYSSRMEFPLSFGLAVLLHLTIVGIAGLAGSLVFSFEAKAAPLQVETVYFLGGSGPTDEKGDSNRLCTLGMEPLLEPPDDVVKQVDEAEEKRGKRSELLEQIIYAEEKARFMSRRGSSGAGDGPLRGKAYEPGPSSMDLKARSLRLSRWTILLPREDPNAFIKKLIDIKASLLVADGDKITYQLCEDVGKRPVTLKTINETDAYNRLQYMSHDPTDINDVTTALDLTKPPRWIAFIIPRDLEQEMARAEFAYQQMPEGVLNKRYWVTHFDVERLGEKWVVKVRYQGPWQQP